MEKLTLLEELTQLRNSIRAKGGTDGKALQVCTDPALAELARLKPKQQKELLYIKGLGKTFAEKYGEQFLAVIAKHTSKGVKSSMLCPEVKETLKNLENRLVNINKRNRLLYMPKISRGTSADLAKKVEGKVSPSAQKAANDYNNKLVEFIKRFDSAKRFLLCDISDGDEALKKHKTLSNVVRESMRSMRETGENPLYIAYPFCIGKLPSEDFEVRAPLVLFPVEIIRDAATIVIKMDTSKDVLFNSGLLLSHKKFSASNEPLPSPVFEDLSSFKFFDQVKSYYAESGLPLKMKEQEGVKPFEEYLSGKFPKFKPGELYLEERVVLGKFPIYSSALQRDFRSIRESDKINELLNHLLERSEDIDIYAETTTTAEMPHILAHSEKNITYINDLNMSQEAAIFTATAGNKLVIQGPPGTGKSQVITSLISDAVVKGKNVLMVSQKKAALDVIYSRLGNANPYAVFISDMKAKEDFYKQMYRLFTLPPESPFSPSSIQSIADRIDGMTNRLDILGTKMFYSEEAYGTPVFEIYEDNVHANAKSTDPIGKAFFTYCPEEFYALGYPKIKDLQHYFSDPF
ncbi:MAG: DUF4011 domain-containing protein, partial [Firmicutes bacterium]|nr:DUF4011 domain-containing protein [Bacillota bacterium]